MAPPEKTSREIKFSSSGIGALLREGQLRVPPNQRSYAWEEKHVTSLLQDFSAAIQAEDEDYFLGTIVLTGTRNEIPEVSDGQQRLATTTILLARIRDRYLQIGKERRANRIETDYLRITDLDSDDIVSKLSLNTDDNQFFINTVLKDPGERESSAPHTNLRESNERLLVAARLVDEHLDNVTSQFGGEQKEETLSRWVKFIDKKANVVIVRVADQATAYRMFETLNDRGLRASQADILKNYFFSKCTGKLDEATTRWSSITGAVETIGDDDILITYIRHYWITLHGPTKGSELADKVRDEIRGQQTTIDFLRQLDEAAQDYVALLNPDHSKWNSYRGSVRRNLSIILSDLKVEQVRPLMFAVARNFAPDEAAKAFELLVNWSVRFLVVGGRGGLLDRQYAIQAQKIGTKQVTKASELTASMREYIPNDATFEDEFRKARVSQSYLARYYLRALDSALVGETEPDYVGNTDVEIVNLEHVMPRKPSPEWKVDPEMALACEKRLGNMVLLNAKKNVAVGNSGFDAKKVAFGTSGFAITRDVIPYAKWTIDEINERQAKLAKLAVTTWPITLKAPQ